MTINSEGLWNNCQIVVFALEMALRQIEKQFGKGSIMKLGESTTCK